VAGKSDSTIQNPDGGTKALSFPECLLLLGWWHNVMRTFALEITPGDFALAGHRRIASSLFAGTLNSAAPFSMAAASSTASMIPSRSCLAAIL
jgi:hypothetical protein